MDVRLVEESEKSWDDSRFGVAIGSFFSLFGKRWISEHDNFIKVSVIDPVFSFLWELWVKFEAKISNSSTELKSEIGLVTENL